MAYRRVCPGRIDLIHKNFRKLCQLLIDVEEWGQLSFLQVLTSYSRTQFLGIIILINIPLLYFHDFSYEYLNINYLAPQNGKKLDPDHRLLLTAATPLLQSRNSAVVIAVVNLFLDLAPQDEIGIVVQPLISLSSSDRRETKFLATKLLTQFTREGLIS